MRGWIYDRVFAGVTRSWYREVLSRLPRGGRLLDIGVGPGNGLCSNAELIQEHDLRVHGVDIDASYLKRAARNLARAGLEDRVSTEHVSIYDHQGGPYDAAYFSCSFMLMPDPVKALEHVTGLLRGEARIYFTHTFNTRRAPVLERIKPLLKKVTTIDFGKVTYEEDFRKHLDAAGLEILEMNEMSSHGALSYRLVVSRPQTAVPAPETDA